MTKRKADMSSEEHERVKQKNLELHKARRAAMSDEQKVELRKKNREAQRRRREKKRLVACESNAALQGRRDTSPLTTPAATPPPENDPLDLVTGVIGIQVEENCETVQWASGQHTVLPSAQVEGTHGIINTLERDKNYVKILAGCPESVPSSNFVAHLSKGHSHDQLLTTARQALSEGKTVIVRGFIDTKGFEFTVGGMERAFQCMPRRKMQVHDMKRRAVNFDSPYIDVTLEQFLNEIDDPKVMNVALDFPLAQLSAPSPFERLDDGLCLGWNQTQKTVPVSEALIPGDVWSVRSWGLAHHAGVLTYPHHDAEGMATYGIPLSGVKNWVLIFPKDGKVNRKDMPTFLEDLTDPDKPLSEFFDRVHCETLHIYPGDLLIMPPGQLHCVYTPIAGFVRGGSLFNMDTMHLTELSRFVDHTSGKFVTNQVHYGTVETLSRLVLTLPDFPPSRKLYKRSLMSLCGMVVYHAKYTPQSEKNQHSDSLNIAMGISKTILESFSLTSYAKLNKFLASSNTGLFCKGEEVTVHSLLKDFR